MGGTAAMGMMIGSGVGQAYGQYQSGEYNAKIANANARVADMQARDALSRGEDATIAHRSQVRGLQGSQVAAAAANGVDVSSGSAADLVASTALLGEQDVMTIRNNAALEAWGFRAQASDLRARASVARAEGRNGAINSLLTTAAQASYFGYETGGWDTWGGKSPTISSRSAPTGNTWSGVNAPMASRAV